MARTTRRSLIAAAALGASLVLAGCSVANPITTQGAYAASDGVRAELGGVTVENLLILTEGEGETGHVLGSIVNHTTEPVQVTLTLGENGGSIPFRLPAEGTVNLTDEGTALESVDVPAGAVLPGSISTSGAGSVSVPVPVLDGTIPPYDEYLASR
ncbi:hypothetical protein [Georgenia sp. SYP-B2076]|uniref:hypothetical protein n=1 Tax=Georgenia sp. SYP-B2076 TaxID=2495881 RepID=UPI000F8DDC55|nr:hypothetical protein [Georgenia sp. SYP-B2076]